jgi:hypothetical protein
LNLYQYAPNAANWIDPWGWCRFGNFKDHARRHGGAANLSPAQYKQHAINHSRNAQLKVKFRHNGETKMAHISRMQGTDKFIFTSTTGSGNRIFTHMPEGVNAQYLGNIGITLPKGF